jgi:hypothetical protein
MKLIIDRNITDKHFYTIDFGVDFDCLIGSWKIPSKFVTPEAMSEADRIITNSPSKVFCITHIKHPLLMKNYTNENTLSNFWLNSDEKFLKKPLREYFALRLIYRKYDVDLYELGKRLF